MKPVLALVGRTNVGKSTLFNCLTKTRDALVADVPGLTRDRQYGEGRLGDYAYIVVDTGGMGANQGASDASPLAALMAEQAKAAIQEAHAILFLVDARAGLMPDDLAIADLIRRQKKPVYVVLNKIDGTDPDVVSADFYRLGLGEVHAIAASHGRGVGVLLEQIFANLPQLPPSFVADDSIRIAVIGRPNVGKSTLINRIIGSERLLAFDMPGTTRDSIAVGFEYRGQHYQLIDTAGVRRRGKVKDTVEKFSAIKAMQAITAAHVVVQLIDTEQGLSDQDLSLLRHVLAAGRALVFVVNKWDVMANASKQQFKDDLAARLGFIDYADFHFISALKNQGVARIMQSVQRAYMSAMLKMPTKQLTDLLAEAVLVHQPPLIGRFRAKLRYAHQGGKNPPRIIIHGSKAEQLPQSYQRYLSNHFQKRLKIRGTPVVLEFRTGSNPFVSQETPAKKEAKARAAHTLKRSRRLQEKKRDR